MENSSQVTCDLLECFCLFLCYLSLFLTSFFPPTYTCAVSKLKLHQVFNISSDWLVTVKNLEGSEVVFCVKAAQLARHTFIDACRRQEILGSEIEDFNNHVQRAPGASSLYWFPLLPSPRFNRSNSQLDQVDAVHTVGLRGN